jgi:UDP-glucose-4-epimerase GalE
MTMPTVLVTGGAGFVGSHTCKALARAGFLPVVYDDLSNGVRDVVRWGPLEVGTLEDEARLASVVTQHEPVAVVHFAAFIEAGQSVREPERFYRNNVSGTLALLRIMRNTGIDKMVFSSTAAVYGEPQCVPISESHPLKPVNPYGRSKLMVEEILADTSAAQGLRYCALRYFNAAGADPEGELGEYHDPETHLIPLALRTAFGALDHLKVFGTDYDTPDGTCIRDYVHVTDLADAHVRATQRLIAGGNNLIANLGIGRGFSVREVIEVVQKITGRRVNAAPSSRRTGDPAVLVADGSIARDELGWTPRYWILEDQVRHASIAMQRRLVRASTACIG